MGHNPYPRSRRSEGGDCAKPLLWRRATSMLPKAAAPCQNTSPPWYWHGFALLAQSGPPLHKFARTMEAPVTYLSSGRI